VAFSKDDNVDIYGRFHEQSDRLNGQR
jgi:hypothetical protein